MATGSPARACARAGVPPRKMSLVACIIRWPCTTRSPWFRNRLRARWPSSTDRVASLTWRNSGSRSPWSRSVPPAGWPDRAGHRPAPSRRAPPAGCWPARRHPARTTVVDAGVRRGVRSHLRCTTNDRRTLPSRQISDGLPN